MTRRRLLRGSLAGAGAAVSARLLAACGLRPATPRPSPGVPERLTVAYGQNRHQKGDLHLPAGTARGLPVVVVVHGGFWRAGYGYDLGTPLATDLANAGYAAWNVEYRRVGGGGGWPTTFSDLAAAVDALAAAVQERAGGRLDLDRVVAVGHSAGGHLAVWAAARRGLPPDAPGAAPRVRLRGAVSQAGVVDLAAAAREGLGGGAAQALLGGGPGAVPERYAVASPYERLPLGVPVALVHGEADDIVPIGQSERYAAEARRRGDAVELVRLPGTGHFELIDPATEAWRACRREVARLLDRG